MPAQYPYLRSLIRPPAPAPKVIPQYCKIAYTQKRLEEYLAQHLRLYIYVWTTGHTAFWMYPLSLSRGILSGYAWRNNRWQYTQLRLAQIDSYF